MSGPNLNVSEKFAAACAPVIDSNYDTAGTLTRAKIDHLSVTDLNALFRPGGLFADLDAWFHHSMEMKACGTKRNAWYDWIMANTDRSMYRAAVDPGRKVVGGPSLLHPFIKGAQETVVNRDYWKLENSIRIADYTAGVANAHITVMTSGPLTATTGGTAVIRVTSRHGLPMDPQWFRQGMEIYVFTSTSGVSQMGSWRVIDSATDTPLSYIDVLVSDAPRSGDSGSGSNVAAGMNYFQLASTGASAKQGVIIPGINNVNDYEAWCKNRATVNPKKLVPFWLQTRRQARTTDEDYRQVYARLVTANAAFAEFYAVDMAEINRQDELDYQKEFVNSFFFQLPISTNQTLDLWESLESINTVQGDVLHPGTNGKIRAKRANFEGVRYQLYRCDRVFDLQAQPLNLLEFFDEVYRIMRVRKTQNRPTTDIDWFTNAPYRDAFRSAMMTYYKDFYQDQLRIIIEPTAQNELGMVYDTYKVGFPGGVNINILSSEFFDDWYDEHYQIGNKELGNLLLCLDMGKPGAGTIYYAQTAANRKRYETARLEELAKFDATFRCVMATTYIEQTLSSEQGTVVVECPRNSCWIENLSPNPPKTTGKTLTPYYTDLV